jgi:molecular chaperone GrpE
LAESENARKRLQKERQELVQYALQNAMCEFLNPIDHFDNALKFTQQASDDVKHWALGFQMILNQFKDALTANGVTAYESVGVVFDPHSHEAVEMVTSTDYPPGTVVNESLKGYKMGDRIIRPARVTVAKAPPEEVKGNEQEMEKDKIIEQNNK